MATSTGGTPYVTSTDLVADYPTASSSLAARVDVVASGSMSKKTASYTVTVADILAGTTICMNSASATVLTLPSTSLVNGMQVNVFSVNTGAVTFSGGTVTGTVTSITAQYSGVSLTYDSAAAVWWCLPFAAGGLTKPTVSGTTGSPTTSTVGGSTLYSWTGNGTITFSTAGWVGALVVSGGQGCQNTTNGGGGGGVMDGYIYVEASAYTVTVGGAGSYPSGSGGASVFALTNKMSFRPGAGATLNQGNAGANTNAVGINSGISGSTVGYGGAGYGSANAASYDSAFGGAPANGEARANSGGGGAGGSGSGNGAAGVVRILV